ncbi:sensor domain-containing diguanylate cyclase [Agrilutibacter solisilvae]|uniref:diguanylate cyclase n=1 Tax=Agrilutibacter solisilvae TaxID=2763317 RepID=A0A974Y047_9GAMM|nr:diguanylate cyclase [Lysobacter solisilvae]QSX78966.1 diguanylate cyclase [Lysobacter solisilvae]
MAAGKRVSVNARPGLLLGLIGLFCLCGLLGLLPGPAGAFDHDTGVNGILGIDRMEASALDTPASQMPKLASSAWIPSQQPHQLAGAQAGRGWWRVHPLRSGDVDRLLLVYHPYSARLTVLVPPDYRPQRASIFDPGLDAGHSRRALAFAVPGSAAGPVYIGVVDARYPLQVALRTPHAYSVEDHGHVRVLWLSMGILLGVSLVTLLFWTLLRERVYLLFAATMLLQSLYILMAYGEVYAIAPLAWLGRFGVVGVWCVATASTIVSVYFLIELAELRPRTPWLSRVLWVVGALVPAVLLLVLLSPWPADKRWFPPIGNALLLLANLLAIVSLFTAWRRGGRHAGLVLIAWVPLVVVSTARALQLVSGQPLSPWLEYGLPLMQAFAAVVLVLGLAYRMLTFRRERDAAKQDAEHDALTGVLNRAGMMRRLEHAIAECRREGVPLSVLFLDLDHFKRINDTHGHAIGDACLCAVTEAIREEMQPDQKLGRLGGEEFLLLMPGYSRRHARDLAERIRELVEVACARVRKAPVGLTLSVGVVESGVGDGAGSLVQRADEAMYQAKHEGRNRVVVLDSARG